MKVYVNRDGEMGGVCPLFFDGAVCDFKELPRPDDTIGIKKVYECLNKIRDISNTQKSFFSYGINNMNTELHRKNIFHKFAALFRKDKYGECSNYFR